MNAYAVYTNRGQFVCSYRALSDWEAARIERSLPQGAGWMLLRTTARQLATTEA